MLEKLHHVAYRCNDARETTDFYTKVLGLKFAKAIVQDLVPSIEKEEPHIHIFFEMGDGSFIAFFDIIEDEAVISESEQDWAQHLALEVSETRIQEITRSLDANGVDYVGPIDHGMCDSYYFYDPSGHRLECSVRKEGPGFWETSANEAYPILAEWNEKKSKINAK